MLVAIPSTTELAAAATTISRILFTRSGQIYGQGAAINGVAIEGFRGFLGLFRCAHGDETEAAWTAAHAIRHQIGLRHGAMGCEHILQVVFRGIEGKISHK